MKILSPKSSIAIQEYQSGQFSNQALAARHAVSLSTIYYWIRRSGAARKPRGARPLQEPTPTHRRMIELSAELTCREIAQRVGVSPQRVRQVLKRWQHLRPLRLKPTKPIAAPRPPKRRELRDHIITFRLTEEQTDRVQATLMSCGLANRVSNGAACRAVLLAAIGAGKFVNNSAVVGEQGENGQNPVVRIFAEQACSK
jgi:transposase